MDAHALAEIALERAATASSTATILELGRAADWEAEVLRAAMHEVLRATVSPRSQCALRLLFYAYEQAGRHQPVALNSTC